MDNKIELSDGSVLLRPYRISDINNLYEAVRESISELSRWMPWCHEDYSIEETRTWVGSRAEAWETGTEYDFAIIEAGTGNYLGGCGLNNIDNTNRIANLGYWVRTSRTKNGVATAATRLLTKYGIENLKLNRIEILVAVDNKISQRVAEKAGASREGILRKQTTIRDINILSDSVMFSLVPGNLE